MVKGGGDPSCKINPTQKPLYHPILNNTTSHGRGGASSLSSVKLKGKHSKGNGRSINNTALFYTCKFQEGREGGEGVWFQYHPIAVAIFTRQPLSRLFVGEKHDWKRIKAIIRGRSILDGDGKRKGRERGWMKMG